MAREHNDALISLGQRMLTEEAAMEIVRMDRDAFRRWASPARDPTP
jgi:hypothetical protein